MMLRRVAPRADRNDTPPLPTVFLSTAEAYDSWSGPQVVAFLCWVNPTLLILTCWQGNTDLQK